MNALIIVPTISGGIFTKTFRYLLVSVFLIINISTAAHCGGDNLLTPEEHRWLNENKSRIVLAVETGYPPFVFLDSKGMPSGLAHDYLRQLESKLGVTFVQKRFTTLDEIFSRVRKGEVQIVNAVTKTPARSEFLSFTEPFISVPNVIVVRKDHQGDVHEKDLAGLKVSLVKSYAITEYLSKTVTGLEADIVPNDLTAILNVSFGQSDAAVIDLATASYLISQKGITNLRMAGEASHNIQLSLAVPRSETTLQRILQKALNSITEAERHKIQDKWIHYTKKDIFSDWRFRAFVGGALCVIALLIIGSLIWNRVLRRQVELQTNELKKEQEALCRSESKHRVMVENITDVIAIIDRNGKSTYKSPNIEKLFGWRQDEVVGQVTWKHIHPDDLEAVQESFADLLGEANRSVTTECRYLCKDGSYKWIEFAAINLLHNPDISGVLLSYHDISKRKQTEDELRESEAYNRMLFDQSPIGLALTRMDGTLVDVNQAYADIIGRTVAETFNLTYWDITPEKYSLQEREQLTALNTSGEYGPYEKEYIHKDGHLVPVRLQGLLIERKGEKYIWSSVEDITERKLSEKMLQESEKNYRMLVNNFVSGVVVHSPDTSIIFANQMASTLLGLSKEQMQRKIAIDPDWCFLQENGSPMPLENYPVNQVLSSGKPLSDLVLGICRPDSSEPVWVLCNAFPVHSNEGLLQQIVVTFSDITKLKLAEEGLNRRLIALTQPIGNSTILFEELFNLSDLQRLQDEFATATGVASLILSPDGVPLTVPSNFTRLCNDIIRTSERGCANCRTSDVAIGRPNPDGPIIQPCLSGGLWDAGAAIVVNGQHIASWLIGQVRDETQTEEKMAAYAREIGVDEARFLEAFREVPSMTLEKFEQISKALFTLATQLSTTAYQNIQQARFITDRNNAEEALWKEKAFLRSLIDSAADLIYFKDTHSVYLGCNKASELFTGLSERDQIGKSDFDFFDKELAESIVTHDKMVLSGGVAVHLEESVITSGGTRLLLDTVKTPIVGQDGQPIGLVGISRDISGQRKAEQQLQQAQKMESIGSLAGGVAHDFNNMLTVIMGHAQLGLMGLEANHPVCDHLSEIMKTGERSADLTRQLLTFARRQTISPKIIDLNEVIDGMLKMLRRLIGESIQLAWQPAPGLWLVKADPCQIDQILANLCVNARDAIKDTGRITIETRNNTVDSSYCERNPEAVPGDYVHLSVSDDGCGMDSATMVRVFEPFFTTKGLGEGTGLGLATVYGIVKQNNGFINIYSEPGKGTTFTIHLPRQENNNPKSLTEAKTAPLPRGQETILLVEDEPAILHITSQLLQKQGYTLLTAGTPGEAMRLAQEHCGEINLLITDVIMPEMNGKDLATRLQSLNPRLKCLFMSGYTADVIAQHGVLDEGVSFIQKPFSLPSLAEKVHEVFRTSDY